ncbi:MAG: GNAT family protein [Burkholderiales bacterium]|nr:GNAT family protein [Burkholderiales bacterium]
MWIKEVELIGEHVKLVPLDYSRVDELEAALVDGDVYKIWYTSMPQPKQIAVEIDKRLQWKAEGFMQPFMVINTKTNQAVGMTAFCRIDEANRRVEIGYTWYGKSVQKTSLNTEAKLLLLSHAFENLNAVAVEFRTNQYNFQSRQAIERLGAKLDGVLRSARVYSDGTTCDGYVYSILHNEWSGVKKNLLYKLNDCYK